MFVCICNEVTERDIREAVARGACNVRQLTRELGVATQCGCCKEFAQEVIDEARAEIGASLPLSPLKVINSALSAA